MKNSIPKNILVESKFSGKTTFLKLLLVQLKLPSECLADCASFVDPVGMIEWLECQITSGNGILLLDNLDLLDGVCESILCEFIDDHNCCFVATTATFDSRRSMQYHRFPERLQFLGSDASMYRQILDRMENVTNFGAENRIVDSQLQGCELGDLVSLVRTEMKPEMTKVACVGSLTTISELVGFETVQERLCSLFLRPTQAIDTVFGLQPCSGVLISGPTGSGKSALVDWLLSMTSAKYQSVTISCADLVHKVVGQSEQLIGTAFATARRKSPCFLIFDNLDMVLGISSDGNSSKRTSSIVMDRMLSSLLVEIDGIHSKSDKEVIVIATCRSKLLMDRSLLRPGRLEEHIELSLPDDTQREAFLLRLTSKLGCLNVPESRLKSLVNRTNGRSFAELIYLEKESSLASVRSILMKTTLDPIFEMEKLLSNSA